MEIENNLNLITNIISMLNFLNFRSGSQKIDYDNGIYILTGQTRSDNRMFAFDFDPDGTILGSFREVEE